MIGTHYGRIAAVCMRTSNRSWTGCSISARPITLPFESVCTETTKRFSSMTSFVVMGLTKSGSYTASFCLRKGAAGVPSFSAIVESLLIMRLQPFGNIQSRGSRITRPGLRVQCTDEGRGAFHKE